MTILHPRHIGAFLCLWILCLGVYAQSTSQEAVEYPPGTPMHSIPVHLMPRSLAGRKRTLSRFFPKDKIQLRFIEKEKAEYYGACHHVDIFVELKTDDGNSTIQSLNPFAFQHAVNSYSCSGNQLNIELSPDYANQARRWNIPSSSTFGLIIPHDFVDLENKASCFTDLSPEAKKDTREHPLESVVKTVKEPRFITTANSNILTLTVVDTDVWSGVNREQSVDIYHQPLDQMTSKVFFKRSTAEQDGPMWDFEHDMAAATKTVNDGLPADSVNTNFDQSSVKGYAQAAMAWKQTCIKGIFTGKMRCINWGISRSNISGMTQINHQTQTNLKVKPAKLSTRDDDTDPMLTLTRVNFTTPSFNLMAPIPLLGFSVPGAFDMGAQVGLGGSVSIEILVQASQDLLVNTGSSTSCPWVIDWNGSFTNLPTIQFGTCTLPGSPTLFASPESVANRGRSENALYFGPNPAAGDKVLAIAKVGATASRETAFVSLGMTVSPSLGMGLKVFGFTALSAGISAPISLGVNSNWDTQSTAKCPANNVEINTDGGASLQLNGGFFGFSKSVPIVKSPTLTSPSICIPK
ncbi:hypothetical protein BGZ76_004955 [Entomortierella beljakovae]|nr:hypothetical protein BGZ76_004955 [Entomortierella beljakovae]